MAKWSSITSLAFFAIAGTTICRGLDLRPLDRARRLAHARAQDGRGHRALRLHHHPARAVVARSRDRAGCSCCSPASAFGIYVSNHWAITQTLAGPLAAGRWTSLQNGIGNLSGIVGAWLTGVAVDRTELVRAGLCDSGGVALTGALMWGAVVGPVREVEWNERRRGA